MRAAPHVLTAALVATTGLVMAVSRRRRSVLRRRLLARPGAGIDGGRRGGPVRGAARLPDPVAAPARPSSRARGWALGLDRAVGRLLRRAARRPPDPVADDRLGRAVLAGAAVLALVPGPAPVVAAVAGLVAWAVPFIRLRRVRARERAALVDETPEIVDLIRLGIDSGLNVRLALDAVVRHHDGLVTAALGAVLDRVERGERLADALDAFADRGAAVQPLVDALVAAERYGAPLTASLDRVATDARSDRRRRREEAARRVPVKLLFPLVFCTLPAFALLTVVPVLLRSLPSFAP